MCRRAENHPRPCSTLKREAALGCLDVEHVGDVVVATIADADGEPVHRTQTDLARSQADREDALRSDGVLEDAPECRRHRFGPPKRTDRDGRVLRSHLMARQRLEDLVPVVHPGRFSGPVRVGSGAETECPDEGLDARTNRRVADPELALHLAQVSARPKEALEEGQLLAREPAEPADAELALRGWSRNSGNGGG